jgi:2-methylcitrate dehydratase PrpD
MMWCIDHPTMVKDGSAWGAAAGVSSALLAEQGFTGAPAGTLIDADTGGIWDDLGQRGRITEQYLKPFPVCRWAHPTVQAVLDLRGRHHVLSTIVERIEVFIFHAATRLDVRQPTTTEEAQYSLPYAVATAFVHGTISPRHLRRK